MKKTVIHIAVLGLVSLLFVAGCQKEAAKQASQPAPASAPSSTTPSAPPVNLPQPSY